MVSAPRCPPGARGLLALLLLLPLPGARGQCGALPRLIRASPQDTSCTEGCPIGTEVTYKCSGDFVKIPGKSDTVVCLENSEWSTFGEFCNGGCGAPPRLKSATLSTEDGQKNYCPPGTTVTYDCRPGYESAEVKRVVTCHENLTWSEASEFCRGKSCGVPKGPEHGRAVVITNDLFGARANITCDEGFRLCGRPFIQCLLKGDQVEWSQLPTCQGIPCKQLELENGRVHLKDRQVGATANFSCDEGYRLIGPTSAQCVVAGNGVNWDKELPHCQGQCGAPPMLSRASPHDTSRTEGFPIGTEVTYRCHDGFVKIPGKSDTVVCLSNLEWSAIGEFCNGSCGVPPRLKSATLSKEDGQKNYCPPGSNVSYVCRPGYESTEVKPVITCLENLTWSEAPEFCIGKSCGVPKGPEHGRAVVITNDLYGARANVICDEGFRLHGRTFIQCLLKGDQVEWSQLPTCQAITCTPPPNITNGMHNGSNVEIFVYNSSVTYKCDHNFLLIGEASIHCTTKDNISGVWDGSAPECKDQCGPQQRLRRDTNGKELADMCGGGSVKSLGTCDSPPSLSFAELPGAVNNSYPVGTELKCSCRPGYVLRSGKSPLVTCLANSTWSVDPEFCVAIPCLPPPDITHGSHTGQSEQEFSFGSAVTYKCDQGFSLIGEASIHCTTKDNVNGEWSGPAPECKGICDSPPRLSFAELPGTVNDSYPVGTELTYSCRPGYVLGSGKSPLVVCLANSTWSVDPEFCVGRLCKQLELENGRVDLTDLRFGATANFSCDEGYRLIGMISAQCVVAGNGVNWDKRLPHCQAIPCLPPPDIANGSHTGQSEQEFSFGSAVTYKCDQGFSLIGEASIHCTTKDNVNGEWSGPAPECKAITCSPPPNIANGTHNGSNVEIFVCNSSVTYKCVHNFSLIGEASIHCTTKDNISGVWNGSVPECKDQCGAPRRLRRDTNGKEVPDGCSGASVKSHEPGFDTRIGIPGIGSNIATVAGITVAAIAIAIAIVTGIVAALKKKGSYGVNLDSPKYHIAPEDDLQMSETKSNLIIKV